MKAKMREEERSGDPGRDVPKSAPGGNEGDLDFNQRQEAMIKVLRGNKKPKRGFLGKILEKLKTLLR